MKKSTLLLASAAAVSGTFGLGLPLRENPSFQASRPVWREDDCPIRRVWPLFWSELVKNRLNLVTSGH